MLRVIIESVIAPCKYPLNLFDHLKNEVFDFRRQIRLDDAAVLDENDLRVDDVDDGVVFGLSLSLGQRLLEICVETVKKRRQVFIDVATLKRRSR